MSVNAVRSNASGDSVLPMLKPPQAFGVVEQNLYRSGAFKKGNTAFVARLKLRTVLFLSAELPSQQMRGLLEHLNIKLVHKGLQLWRPEQQWRPVNDELVKEALEFALDVTNQPICIMCTSGRHETGSVVGCLRRLQNWTITSIVDEYRRYAGVRARYANEQFIELFDVDLITIPANHPQWLKDQVELWRREAEERSRSPKEAELDSTIPMYRQSDTPDLRWRLVSPNVKFDMTASIVDIDD